MYQWLMKLKNYIMKKDTYECDIALLKFCAVIINFSKIIIISHNILLTSGYICSTFYTFGTKSFIFHLSDTHLSAGWEDEKPKNYYDKYIYMLTIRNDQW